jgi:hypothetical protein
MIRDWTIMTISRLSSNIKLIQMKLCKILVHLMLRELSTKDKITLNRKLWRGMIFHILFHPRDFMRDLTYLKNLQLASIQKETVYNKLCPKERIQNLRYKMESQHKQNIKI